MKVVIQYNQIKDVIPNHRDLVEKASGEPIDELDIQDVNSFLNGLYIFNQEQYVLNN